MSEITQPKVTGPASYFPAIEKAYGHPVTHWQELLRSREGYAQARHMELVSWLKTEHDLGHGHANALVAAILKQDRA